MRNGRRLFHREEGVALVMVLAFMALAIPVVTGALGLASTLSIDSRVKTNIAKNQFTAIGANEYAVDLLEEDEDGDGTPDVFEEDDDGDGIPNVWEDEDGDGEPDGDDFPLDLNDDEVEIHIQPSNPDLLSPPDGEGLVVDKTVIPDTAPENDPDPSEHTFTITVENTASHPIPVTKIFDGLPPGFDYSPGTAILELAGEELGSVPFDDPTETMLWFDEGDHSQGGKMMLTWDIRDLDVVLQPGEILTLTLELEGVDLDEGYYCNTAWIEPEGSGTRTGLTARIEVGEPSSTTCVGEEVSVTGSVNVIPNPDDDPADPNDDIKITYSIVITNGGPNDLHLWWLRDKLPPGFKYKWGSTTGDITSKNPFALTFWGRQRLNWFFLFPTVEIPANGGQKMLIFEAVAPREAGNYYNEVWAFFVEYDDEDAVYSWPSSLVMMADMYQVTVDGEPTSEVWVLDGESEVRRWYIDP